MLGDLRIAMMELPMQKTYARGMKTFISINDICLDCAYLEE